MVRKKLSLAPRPFLEILVIGAERRAQVRTTCSILNNRSLGKNLRSTSGQASA
jgi:hypothetical protein